MVALRRRLSFMSMALLLGMAATVAALLAGRAVPDESRSDAAQTAFGRGQSERLHGLRLLHEAGDDHSEARKHFEQSARAFGEARLAFASRVRRLDPPGKALSAEFERVACCRCCEAEMRIALGQDKQAREILSPLLEESIYRNSAYRRPALYYQGISCLRLGELVEAGRALGQLAPFTDRHYGLHARYLLARVYHRLDEVPEAAVHYQGVIDGYESQRKHAAEILRTEPARDDPDETARLRAVVDQPAPGYVVHAVYCQAVLRYEQGRFEESQKGFTEFLAREADPHLKREARVCLGMTQVQLGKYADAIETLGPLTERNDAQATAAAYWLGNALFASVQGADPDSARETVLEAAKYLRQAADRFGIEARKNPAKSEERGVALMELAASQQAAGKHNDALGTLQLIAEERLLPGRAEELLQRQLTAAHLAGSYRESDGLCERFIEKYPASPLRAEVDFRHAENAHFLALSRHETDREALLLQAAKGYRKIVDTYPEFELVPWVQYELAVASYRKGEYDRCRETLERIPFTERRGPLAAVSYLLADCLMRTAPTQADDALAAGQLQEQLQAAIDLLKAYVEDRPEPPLMPEALLRLGLCKERLSALQAKPEEHDRLRDEARGDFERLLVEFPLHELQPHAALERNRCLTEDDRAVIDRLRRFTREPLRKSSVAPLAVLRVASLLRGQDNGAREASQLLGRCRRDQEEALLADPVRARWVPLLHYQHAIALLAADKPADAGTLLDEWCKRFEDHPLATEVRFRREQCRLAEGQGEMDRADQRLGSPELSEEEKAGARKLREHGSRLVHSAVEECEKQAESLGRQESAQDIRAALLYQAAWAHRSLAEPEVNEARSRIQEELRKKLQDEVARKTPKGQSVSEVPAPEVPLSKVPVQPEEKKTREDYARLLRDMPTHPLALQAALELAEAYADREDHTTAIRLLKEALDREPAVDLTDRIRLRLAMCSLAQKNEKTALVQLELVAGRADSPLAPQAHLRAAECLLAQRRWKDALKHLAPFRDQEDFRNLSGLSDRALLLLGHALIHLEKWHESRTAFALLLAGFGQTPLAEEARYRMAWAEFRQKNYGDALGLLEISNAENTTDLSRQSRLLRAACYLEKKHYGQAIDLLSDLAATAPSKEIAAFALLEWSHASSQTNKEEAEKLLKQVLEKYPDSDWAGIARQRMKASQESTAPHTLTAAQRVLEPKLLPAVPLEAQGQMQSVDPPGDDPTFSLSLDYALSSKPPERSEHAPVVRLGVSDPFEHRKEMRGKIADAEVVPVFEEIRLPK